MKGKIYTLTIGKLNVFEMRSDVIGCFKFELSLITYYSTSDIILTGFFHEMIFKAIHDHIFICYGENM